MRRDIVRGKKDSKKEYKRQEKGRYEKKGRKINDVRKYNRRKGYEIDPMEDEK